MTDSLLDNELVRNYFSCSAVGCERGYLEHKIKEKECMSFRILQAMQAPIRKGERYLAVWHCAEGDQALDHIDEQIADQDQANWHPDWLRLPSAFQKQEEIVMDCKCGFRFTHKCEDPKPTPSPEVPDPWKAFIESKPKDAAVEERIALLVSQYKALMALGGITTDLWKALEKDLFDLVRLARESK